MINSSIVVSIVIPVYNTGKYLKKCLESVINQTFPNLQIILVNDGSTDDSIDIIQSYLCIDNRIEFIDQSNGGAAKARNAGIKRVKGDYVFFVDSDDWIELDTIYKLLETSVKKDADVVIPNKFNNVYEDGRIVENLLFIDLPRESLEDFVVEVIIGQARAWRVSSVLYKTEIIKNNNVLFPEGHIAEDVIFNLKFLAKAQTYSVLDYPTLNVNKRSGSVTSRYNKDLMETYFMIDDECNKYVKRTNYDSYKSRIAIESLLCRNLIVFIRSELSNRNQMKLTKKISRLNSLLKEERVRKAINTEKFIFPYWDRKSKVLYVATMRLLLKYRMKYLAFILARLSNLYSGIL